MKLLDEVVGIAPSDSIRTAAERMHREGVGCLMVLDEANAPLGILTDRDLALRAVAWSKDPEGTKVEEVMTSPVDCLDESEPNREIIKRMSALGVRRMPLTKDGKVVGLVSLDDLALQMSDGLSALSVAQERKIDRARRKADREQLIKDAEEVLEHIRDRVRQVWRPPILWARASAPR